MHSVYGKKINSNGKGLGYILFYGFDSPPILIMTLAAMTELADVTAEYFPAHIALLQNFQQ